MQSQKRSRRQVLYALIFALLVGLTGISLVGGSALADVLQNDRAFLPLIRVQSGGTIPPASP